MKPSTKRALWIAAGVLVAGVTVAIVLKGTTKRRFLAALPAAGKAYGEFIWSAAKRNKIDPTLLAAVISHESGFGLYLSPRGPAGTGNDGKDLGLAQLNADAQAPWLASHDWRDPEQNIERGAEVLAEALEAFPGNPAAAVAAYNAGRKRVRQALDQGKEPGSVTTHDKEGRSYVTNVVAQLERLQSAAAAA